MGGNTTIPLVLLKGPWLCEEMLDGGNGVNHFLRMEATHSNIRLSHPAMWLPPHLINMTQGILNSDTGIHPELLHIKLMGLCTRL
jgi:hypothetical protein